MVFMCADLSPAKVTGSDDMILGFGGLNFWKEWISFWKLNPLPFFGLGIFHIELTCHSESNDLKRQSKYRRYISRKYKENDIVNS
jgi:hypothetical protein